MEYMMVLCETFQSYVQSLFRSVNGILGRGAEHRGEGKLQHSLIEDRESHHNRCRLAVEATVTAGGRRPRGFSRVLPILM